MNTRFLGKNDVYGGGVKLEFRVLIIERSNLNDKNNNGVD
jgi:hypothetical protein